MISMSFKCDCDDCDYEEYSQFYRKYEIRDGEKVYLGHPGDIFAKNAIEENPYIHKETRVIKWFEKGEKIPREYESHCGQIPYCPNCKKELKLSGFIGCM